jgi:hypothetical protein
MNRLLLSLAAKLGLFLASVGLGAGAYLVVNGEASVGADPSGEAIVGPAFAPGMVLDAEPHLLARVEAPVDVAGDAFGVFYILQRDGRVVRTSPLVGGGASAATYAELADDRTLGALGFGGLVLHPNFLLKGHPGCGRLYVLVSEEAGAGRADFLPEFGGGPEHHQDVLYEYEVEDPLLPEFRGVRRELMRFSQPGPEHNVRGLAFDPEGLLYLGVGDGAAAEIGRNSPSRNASSLTSAYGKVLRIDPLGHDAFNGQYGLPDGNPFRLVSGALPELWAFGLRAPGSLSYDPFMRGLCIADRARSHLEEIRVSLHGGEHFGWDIGAEAARLGRAARARLAEVVSAPAVSLDLRAGLVAPTSGSLVYRGEHFPALAGALLFASRDGQILALRPDGGKQESTRLAKVELGRVGGEGFAGLRSGPRGEIVLLCEDGRVLEMRKGASLGTGGSKQRSLFCEAGSGDRDHDRL